jgi:hypothetical protein
VIRRVIELVRGLTILTVAGLAMFVGAPSALAEDDARLPVITAGREQEVLALFKPYELGSVVAPGWKLQNVNISETSIRVEIVGPSEAKAVLRLELSARDPSSVQTSSFAVHREATADPAGEKALDLLLEAVRKNDTGEFWRHASSRHAPAEGADGARRNPPRVKYAGVRRLALAAGAVVILTALAVAWRRSKRAEPSGDV